MYRFVIVKDRGAGAGPRSWQLWMTRGVLCSLLAERSSQARCVKVMDRLIESA